MSIYVNICLMPTRQRRAFTRAERQRRVLFALPSADSGLGTPVLVTLLDRLAHGLVPCIDNTVKRRDVGVFAQIAATC